MSNQDSYDPIRVVPVGTAYDEAVAIAERQERLTADLEVHNQKHGALVQTLTPQRRQLSNAGCALLIYVTVFIVTFFSALWYLMTYYGPSY